MPWIETAELKPHLLNESQIKQIYCGLDSAVTVEVLGELRKLFNSPPAIYNFERALQAPYLEMMQRGWLVDEQARRIAASSLHERRNAALARFHSYTSAICDEDINPGSPAQLQKLLYQKMRLPEQHTIQKGVRRVSVNRECLEKLEIYLYARPLVALIFAIRECDKQLQRLENQIDRDSRIRCSYNIAGTETGRPSSSENAFGTGDNMQNVPPNLRYVNIADRGKKLCQIDLEQVEARDVGFFEGCLFGDWRFLDACEGGDLHTSNARLVWPELPWTGDLSKDKKIAGRTFYREFSYRDMAKRGSHLSNYSGTVWTMARALKIPQSVAEEFQARYCRGREPNLAKGITRIIPAFPAHTMFWSWVAQQLQLYGHLTTPFGRKRHFFGRLDSGETLREAIAFLPQSTTADRMNLGLWRVWNFMPEVELLGQGFDSITFQYDEDSDEDAIVSRALELIRVELRSPSGRSYIVPGEAKVGWNWGGVVEQKDIEEALSKGRKPPRLNLDGLKKWTRGKRDSRVRLVGLDRIAGGGK